ncbi:MAG: ferrous iron transport protein B [Candidatus Nezhaarchaeota archaeon]|nr:ferrous iron transport protein B [Candidatus Nezhaarchaeota archaeon]
MKLRSRVAKKLRIALAGNANVGKSVIFNYLTGLHQHIGNWPGKTVEKAEGTLYFKGYAIDVVDLPGIYSFSTFSMEEEVSRDYIVTDKPDVVINVVDASALERNLYFTLQLIELEAPLVIALNQVDVAKKKGIEIDVARLEEALGAPVIPTVAIRGRGLHTLLEKAIQVAEEKKARRAPIRFGEEVEERVAKLTKEAERLSLRYPPRYIAIRLLEGDEAMEREVASLDPKVALFAKELAIEIEKIHGHPCHTVIAAERYEAAGRIAREVQRLTLPAKPRLEERLHDLTTHRVAGYLIMASVLLSLFHLIFTVGSYASGALTELLYGVKPFLTNLLGAGVAGELAWNIMEGVIAVVTIALPYIIPLYIALYFLEDSGYLGRAAFLMDSVMHKVGLHGKAIIPLILGYGCSVPACLGCRIMETHRERLLAIFVTTLVPCAARTVVILSLVGRYLGTWWALALYAFNLAVVFTLGRLAFKSLPGEPTALIMEMPDYKWPHLVTVLKQTWFRVLEFAKIALPLMIVGGLALRLMEALSLLKQVTEALSPITVAWLGLPAITGVAIVFGVLRKELALVMLAELFGTADFAEVPGFGGVQMVVFTVVIMFYIPCVATIAALVKEVGWRRALLITAFEVAFAIALGGLAFRALGPLAHIVGL